MTESLKFGPEWLRESIRKTSPKQDDYICRPILSNYRYSREEMLGMIDERNSRKTPEVLPRYKRMYVNHWQSPLALLQYDEERLNAGRLFINSNIKNGSNFWRNKNREEDSDKNWRLPNGKESKKENMFSSVNMKSAAAKKNWREKSAAEDAMYLLRSPNKSHDNIKIEKENVYPKENIAHEAEFFNNHNSKKVEESPNENGNFTEKVYKNHICEDKREDRLNDTAQKDANIDDCELNWRKLESDLLMNLSDLTVDDEKDAGKVTWYYVDPLGKVQGPFKEEEMSLWYTHGFFYDTLMLRRSIDTDFISLKYLIHAFGNAQPFMLASTGFPIPKLDNHFDNIQNTFKPPPPQMPLLNSQPNQWSNMMAFSEMNQYENMQYSVQNQNPQVFSQYPPNRPSQQQMQSQIDPRMYNMNSVNPYGQMYGSNMNANHHQQRPPQTQLTPQMYHQQQNLMNMMKPSVPSQLINPYPQQMVPQMSIMPPNPIQKLLYELQKQKEIEQQRQALYSQQNNLQNSYAAQTINEQLMQQQNMKRIDNDAKMHQNCLNNQQKSINSTTNNMNTQQNAHEDKFSVDDEGEFRMVGNIKRKKTQKEIKKEQEKSQFQKQTAQNSYTNNSKGDGNFQGVKRSPEERSKLPAAPAPWIDKIKKTSNGNENLKRIQIEEEEIRQIQKQIDREIELLEKEQEAERNKKMNNLTWNSVVVESIAEKQAVSESIFEVPQKVKPNKGHKKLRQENKSKQQQQKDDMRKLLSVEKENEFKNWCIDYLSKMNTKIDIPVFTNFLAGLESPYEVEDYIKMYLGDSIESTLFTRKFLERRSSYRKAAKIVEIDDDLCGRPKAINPGANEDNNKSHRKRNAQKKTKKSMKVADINILGFKATAASNRIVGELHEDEY